MENGISRLNHFQLANNFHYEGDYPKALQHYELYLETLPVVEKWSVEKDMTSVVFKLGSIFEESDNDELALQIYLKLISHFPKNYVALNLIGVLAFKKGDFNTARSYWQESLQAVQPAKFQYLAAEKNLLHLTWLEVPRWHFRMLNDSMRNECYRSAINRAIDQGYRDVFDIGCGCGLLTLIAASHKKSNKVTAFEENGTLLEIARQVVADQGLEGKVEFHQEHSNDCMQVPANCNLIVTEIFDVALFGERALDTFKHALNVFVKQKDFKIIPSGAKMYLSGIESDKLIRKHRFIHNLPSLGLENICVTVSDAETYDAERLSKDNAKFVTETKQFLNVDFKDIDDLQFDEIELECIENGTVHAIAVWFDLILDEQTEITTNPFGSSTSWEQAVFYLDHPVDIKKNEVLKLKPALKDSQLSFEIPNACKKCFKVSKEIVTFLNDADLIEMIIDGTKNFDFDKKLNVIDFNVFPLFGLLMCKNGAKVCHVYKNSNDVSFLKHVIQLNKICSENIFFTSEKLLSQYVTSLSSFDVIMADFISADGCWNKFLPPKSEAMFFEQKLNIMPRKITMKAVLVNAPYLDFCNKVDDDKALNFGIAKYMNAYTGNEHPNIEAMNYEEMSEIVTIDLTTLGVTFISQQTEVTKNGIFNGIMFWYELEFSDGKIFSTFNSSHYSRACSILENNETVKQNQLIYINVRRSENYMKIFHHFLGAHN